MNYIYRIYGATSRGYKLIVATKDEEEAFSYTNDSNYQKVLIIRHNIEKDMDEPISLTFPEKEFIRTKRK